MTSLPDGPQSTKFATAKNEALALIITILVAIASGGSPLFTTRWLYIGYPLAALYAATAIGETYHHSRKYRFKRRLRRFREAQAAATAQDDERA